MSKATKTKNNNGNKKIAVVVSRFNDFITEKLLEGCLDKLGKLGVKKNNITVVWVPGAFEIPVVALKLAKKKSINAVICLGSIIRGETAHFDLVAQGTAQGIAQVSLMTGKPVIFEVLATETVEHARKRSKKKGDNKGRDAAVTAIEMIDVLNGI